MAPETLAGQKFDHSVDVWALGVITAELLLGHLPFNGKNKEELFTKICNDEPNLIGGPKRMLKGGTYAKNFIKRCLEKDPAKRPYPPELLEDQWIKMMQPDDEDDVTDSEDSENE